MRPPTTASAQRLEECARYQGEHARRVGRLLIAIPTAVVLWPALVTPRPMVQFIWTGALLSAIFLVGELLVARRGGFTVRPEELTLHTVLGWRRVPWSRIDHFEWRRWSSRQTEWFGAITVQGKRVAMPTVQRAARAGKVNALFTSERLRIRDGRIVDAMETLTAALASARRATPAFEPVA